MPRLEISVSATPTRRLLRNVRDYRPMHAVVLLAIEGLLLCGFIAIFEYAPEVSATNRDNVYAFSLNGRSRGLPITYARKSQTVEATRGGRRGRGR